MAKGGAFAPPRQDFAHPCEQNWTRKPRNKSVHGRLLMLYRNIFLEKMY